ncbi:hypothetical protein LIER_13576 [Lithospermum erythrorhizon]|uniref:Uncharacterized protein n=1 Tax=Lithospermum erythrorhizon TaxID=34254 RepID=A0AAV3PY57_LITER
MVVGNQPCRIPNNWYQILVVSLVDAGYLAIGIETVLMIERLFRGCMIGLKDGIDARVVTGDFLEEARLEDESPWRFVIGVM